MDFLLQERKKEERKGEFEEGSSKQPIQLALFNRDECYATGIDAAKGIGYRRCRYALFHGFIKPQADRAREYVIDNGKLASSISTLRISYTSLHASPHFVFLARVEETWTRNRIRGRCNGAGREPHKSVSKELYQIRVEIRSNSNRPISTRGSISSTEIRNSIRFAWDRGPGLAN